MAAGRLRRVVNRLALLLIAGALAAGLSPAPLAARAAPSAQSDPAVDEIRRQVAQVRGLELKAETPLTVLPKAALVGRLSRPLNTDHAVREFLTSQMLLEVLGAQPRGFDLRQLQLRLLDEQTLAVYDYSDRTIFLIADALSGGTLSADARLVVAHEATHALQDQHFNLRRILPTDPENSDADTAARALVEGDAMLTMRIWGRQFLRPADKRSLGDDTTPQDTVLDSAPPLVRGELLFPYDAGWVFAQLLYQDGGFDAVNQAFQRPPRSTEQILHPEKWQAGENPVSVTIRPLERSLGGTWVTRRTDVFGELVLRLLLEPTLGWPTAEAAAAGWGGDAYTILEDASGRRIVGMVTVWDTEADAAEMYNAWASNIEVQYKTDQVQTVTLPAVTRWAIPEYRVQALKTDNVVRIVFAPDDVTVDQVDALLANATIGPAGPVAPTPTGTATPSGAPTATPRSVEEPDGTPGPLEPSGTPGTVEPSGTPGPSGTPSRTVTPAGTAPPAGTPIPGSGSTPAPAATPPATPASPDDDDDD
ncbi:MAG: hypothetical protein U0893_17445 [Chloroflexota bacterium]